MAQASGSSAGSSGVPAESRLVVSTPALRCCGARLVRSQLYRVETRPEDASPLHRVGPRAAAGLCGELRADGGGEPRPARRHRLPASLRALKGSPHARRSVLSFRQLCFSSDLSAVPTSNALGPTWVPVPRGSADGPRRSRAGRYFLLLSSACAGAGFSVDYRSFLCPESPRPGSLSRPHTEFLVSVSYCSCDRLPQT